MNPHLDPEAHRQLTRILDAGAGTLASLGRMVTELEQFHSNPDALPVDLRREYYSHWVALEEVFAVTLDRGLATVTDEGARIVDAAIAALRVFAARRAPNDTETDDE